MPGAATNTAKPDHLHFSNLKCGWTKAKANVLCSFMWCCHFLLFLLILFKLHCSKHWWPAQALIGANESLFQSCYNLLFLPTSAMKTQGYISPRVNVIVLNICCLWAILELFKRRTATSGQDCLGFTVRKWLISKTSCLFVCMRHVAGL